MIIGRKSRIITDDRGKIKSGMLGRNRDNTMDIPKSLDHFNVSKFSELVNSYGPEPKELFVFCPSNNVADCFDDRFACYGGNNTLKRKCDGVTCLHRINANLNGNKYAAGEETPCICKSLPDEIKKGDRLVPNPEKCRYLATIKFHIAIPPEYRVTNSACYLFETGSKNSGDNIFTELDRIHRLKNGQIYGLPFKLSVKMAPGRDDAKKLFPIWELRLFGLLNEQNPERMITQGFVPDSNRVLVKAEEVEEKKLLPASSNEVPIFDIIESELAQIELDPTDEALSQFIAKHTTAMQGLNEEQKIIIRAKYNELKAKIKEKSVQ